jgi:uncharacterized protein
VSYSIDANLLLYASNSTSRHQEAAIAFLEECTSRREVLYLAWPTAMAYLRVSTHPTIFPSPLRHAEALANLTALISRPNVRMITETDGFLDVYTGVAGKAPVRGNLLPDAHLAALLLQNGIRTLYTNDVDFRRFDFLDVRNPLA